MTGTDRRRRLRPLIALTLLAIPPLFVAAAVAIATAFNVGVTTGMMAAGTTVLVYQVPAVLFDWPRITFEHVVAFFSYLGSLIWSIFDW